MIPNFDRRRFLQLGGAVGLGLLGDSLTPGLQRALASSTTCGSLSDIQHVVIFIQENRSFDHYFGTYRGVRGFSDAHAPRQANGLSVFNQPGYPPGQNPNGYLLPFHLNTQTSNAECTNDITHSWAPQHQSWNNGKMDSFVRVHMAQDGAANGPLTMGYYTRTDLAYYYALADAFTICDDYHCSVLGPTDPNRLYSMSASIDPDGKNGGPLIETLSSTRAQATGTFGWTTMPEQLQARGISWKIYSTTDGNAGDNVLTYFKQYQTNPQLAANAFTPTFPGDFQADCASGLLPQVSWVLAPLAWTEHPPSPPDWGQYATEQVLNALTSNANVWAHSALFVTYDENGGFFDHVPPPTPPLGTPGEYLTVNPLPSAAGGIAGPIGLGFRVPLLVVSPFSRGGFVCSDRFDHTSLLTFLETRFGAEVPNLTPWRRSVVGDLTSAFNFAAPNASVPPLPQVTLTDPAVTNECVPAALVGTIDENAPTVPTYPVPPNSMPSQEPGAARRPSGAVRCTM